MDHLGWDGPVPGQVLRSTEQEQDSCAGGMVLRHVHHVGGKKYVGSFVPQYPIPGGSMIETAEGEVPVLITQTRATPGRERSTSAQLQLISTSINLHSLSGAASPPSLCLVLSCLFSCRVKLLLPMSVN